jgi:hypothetical protein
VWPSTHDRESDFRVLVCLPTAPGCHSRKRGLRHVAGFWAVLGQASQLAYAYQYGASHPQAQCGIVLRIQINKVSNIEQTSIRLIDGIDAGISLLPRSRCERVTFRLKSCGSKQQVRRFLHEQATYSLQGLHSICVSHCMEVPK